MTGVKRLMCLKEKIENILENNYEARDNDKILYYEVCKDFCLLQGIDVDSLTLRQAMFDKKLILPNMESVRRCRQKIQEENPKLWGDRREERMQAMAIYEEFSRE